MKKGFTLAEVLITMTIVGVVASLAIPSVISNTQQAEYKTGLRKAVSVLNAAISAGYATSGDSPYVNGNTFGYFAKHMSILKSTIDREHAPDFFLTETSFENASFYTTDGMRYEFRKGFSEFGDNYNATNIGGKYPIYESPQTVGKMVYACTRSQTAGDDPWWWMGGNTDKVQSSTDGSTVVGYCGGCGSYGLENNPYNTKKPPCLIMVDINGDRKPNPANALCTPDSPDATTCRKQNKYKLASPDGRRLTDMFTIMITESRAIPWGTAAQRAMYNDQKK